MTMHLDHVFILVAPGAPMANRLLTQGFREGPSNTHPGQGTANRLSASQFCHPVGEAAPKALRNGV